MKDNSSVEVTAGTIIVGSTNRLTSGEGVLMCGNKKEPLNSPQHNNMNCWARLVTPEQSNTKTSPGCSGAESPVIQTLQQPPLLNVVGIQLLGNNTVRGRSQEVPVTSLELSAQLVQTKEGPKMVLEGLRDVQLDQKQLEEIRELVVEQLYTSQVLARLQERIPPSKVSLTIRGQFSRVPPRQQPRLIARLPQSVIQHGQFVHHEERGRVLLLPRNILRAYETRISEENIKVCSCWINQIMSIKYFVSITGLFGDQIKDRRGCKISARSSKWGFYATYECFQL